MDPVPLFALVTVAPPLPSAANAAGAATAIATRIASGTMIFFIELPSHV
jgi:hypothetical protein